MEQLYLLYGSLSITVVDGGWRMVNRRSHFVLRQRAFAMYNNTTWSEREQYCTTARDVSHRIYQMRIAFSSLPVWIHNVFFI